MDAKVKKFIHELASYVNTYIVGSENTVITKCDEVDMKMNRGHAIPVHVKNPDGIDDNAALGPCFYAEELMEENKKATVAAIAEMLNVEINGWYGEMEVLAKAHKEAAEKRLEDYGPDDIILSAVPTKDVNELTDRDKFITRDFPELGITAAIKGMLCKSGNGQAYFTSIRNDGRPVTEEDWENAKKNSAAASSVSLKVADGLFGMEPFLGLISDDNGFYDYFYLLSPEVWKPIARQFGADTFYIIPQNAHAAQFFMDGPAFRESPEGHMMKEHIMRTHLKGSGILPGLVLDISTMKFRKWEDRS